MTQNTQASCDKYIGSNNKAELFFSDANLNKIVENFEYDGTSLSVDFDYSTTTDVLFAALIKEKLVNYKLTLTNIFQEGAVSRISHTHINATNCWNAVELTYEYKKFL